MTLHDNDGDNEKNDDGDDDDANDDGDDDDDGEEPTCTHHGYSSDSPSQEITVIINFRIHYLFFVTNCHHLKCTQNI